MSSVITTRAAFVLFVLISCVSAFVEPPLEQFVSGKEALVRALAAKAEAAHTARCTKLAGCKASQGECSIPACGSSFTASGMNLTCTSTLGSDTETCGSQSMMRSFTKSAVRVPLSANFTDPALQAFTCGSASLDADLRAQNNTAWVHIGSDSGGSRTYPGMPQGRSNATCRDYDPRHRSWYTTATSGPKDIVIIFDGTATRPPVTTLQVEAMHRILDATSENDFVQIVGLEITSRAPRPHKDYLMRMSSQNRTFLKNFVSTFRGSGYYPKNFMNAFEKAFLILGNASVELGTSSGCNRSRIVIFMSPGDSALSSQVLPTVRAAQARLGANPARVITYSLTSVHAEDNLQNIACEYKGLWALLNTREDVQKAMLDFRKFLHVAVAGETTAVRWSSPYMDEFGLGEVVTAAVPFYDQAFPVLAGVVGVDVTIKELQQVSGNSRVFSEELSAYLAERTATCVPQEASECARQIVRKRTVGYTCPLVTSLDTCERRGEMYKVPDCSGISGGLNNVLCEPLSEGTLLAQKDAKPYKQLACCNSKCESVSAGLSYEPSSDCLLENALANACHQSWTKCREAAQSCHAEENCLRVRTTCFENAANWTTVNTSACSEWSEGLKSAALYITVGGAYEGSELQTACIRSGCSWAGDCYFDDSLICTPPRELVQYVITLSGGFTESVISGTAEVPSMGALSTDVAAMIGIDASKVQILQLAVINGSLTAVLVIIPGTDMASEMSTESVQELLWDAAQKDSSFASFVSQTGVSAKLASISVDNLPPGATPVPAPTPIPTAAPPPSPVSTPAPWRPTPEPGYYRNGAERIAVLSSWLTAFLTVAFIIVF